MPKIEFDSAALKANRNPLRRSGSNLGGQFYRIKKYAVDDTAGEKIAKIAAAGNKDLCLNRGIARIKIDANDIFSVRFGRDGDDNNIVILNEGDDSEARVTLQTLEDTGSPFLDANDENISRALKSPNTKNIIFANPDDIVDKVNALNENEIARIDAMISQLQKAKNLLNQTIKNNYDRAQNYKNELRNDSKGDTVVIAGHVETEA